MMQQQDILERHQAHYTLEFRFLPELVEACQKGELPVDALGNFAFWNKCLTDDGKNSFAFDWGELTADVEHVDDATAIVKYTFPSPLMEPEALFAAVVMNRKEKTLEYYTLEKSFNNTWTIGKQNGSSHHNKEQFNAEPTMPNFISRIKEIIIK